MTSDTMRANRKVTMLLPLSFGCAYASLGTSSASVRPNMLFFFPDELRYDWGGVVNNPYYNNVDLPLITPHLDDLARNGVRFTRAFVGAPVCAPSRACLASGRQYDENTVPQNFHNDFDANVTTFYKILRDEAGYHTMVTGRDDLDKSSGGPGENGSKHANALGFSDQIRCDGSTDVTRGGVPHEPFGNWLASQSVDNATIARRYNSTNLFDLQLKRYAELGHSRVGDEKGPFGSYAIPDPMPLPDKAYQDNWIGEQALTLLQRRPRDRPFFIEVSHQAPHPPMDITASMMTRNALRQRRFPTPTMNTGVPNATVVIGRQNYAAKIEQLDYWLGQYKALLKEQDVLDNTIICVASDHGEMLFDRGGTAKSKPWSSASSVPLICGGPAIEPNRVVDRAVSTVDLAPTFLDFAGVLSKAPAGMSQDSLMALMTAETQVPKRNIVRFGLNNFRGVVEYVNATHVYKFFCCNGACPGSTPADRNGTLPGDDEYHLFNIADDRFELPASELCHVLPARVARYIGMLPPRHVTPANPNSSIPSQGHGYMWNGCLARGI
eukprot:m.1125554 g.1125554  ORF g.1125554 m.1125554 type:complete len:552 (+) comp24409_c0_seq3:305-1960(+)